MSEYTALMDDVHAARMKAWQASQNGEALDPGDILDILGRPDETEIRRWQQEQE